MNDLYQISAPHFCAGLEVNEAGSVVKTAPILFKQFYRKPFEYVRQACAMLGWDLEEVGP